MPPGGSCPRRTVYGFSSTAEFGPPRASLDKPVASGARRMLDRGIHASGVQLFIYSLGIRYLRRRQMRRFPVGWIVIALFFGVAAPAFAQQGTSEIGGRVTDEQ